MNHCENKDAKPYDIEQFREALKKHSMKATPQRIAVHEAMLRLGHASADMVWNEIRKDSTSKITVASVYNVLDKLAAIGIYQHRLSANNKMYFDVNTYHHMHIYDCKNNCYRDIVDEGLMHAIEDNLAKKRFRGYHIEEIDIQFVCSPTKKKYKISR